MASNSNQTDQVYVYVEQTGQTLDSASYYMKVSRRGDYFWGGRIHTYIVNHLGPAHYLTYWAAPEKTKWNYNSSSGTYYKMYKGRPQTLAWEYYKPQAGWIAASSVEYWFSVDINRGGKRQGSKYIEVGTHCNGDWSNCKVGLTLYTDKIADPSNLKISATVNNNRSDKNRTIKITSSFTNPHSWYGGGVYEGNTYVGPVGTFEIPITKAMYNQTKTYTLKVWGDDYGGTSKPTTTATILPGGVGVTVKKSGNPKEVKEVWYKDNWGNIHEITELWVRRNSNNYETVK